MGLDEMKICLVDFKGPTNVQIEVEITPEGDLLCALGQSGWVNLWRAPSWTAHAGPVPATCSTPPARLRV